MRTSKRGPKEHADDKEAAPQKRHEESIDDIMAKMERIS